MKSKAITIYDLANELSLSASTISRALNDDPRVKEETKQKVRSIAQQLNYKPNTMASSLRNGATKTIGVIVPQIKRNFFANAISGIESVANREGFRVMITQTLESYESEVESLEALIAAKVDGILMSLSVETNDYQHLENVIERGTPIVFFDRVVEGLKANKVVLNDYAGAYAAVEHLVKIGCQKIAHLGGPHHINIYRNRYRGYQDALQHYGMPIKKEWIFTDALRQDTGEAACRQMFEGVEQPDGIFAAGDYSALGAIQYLRSHGIAVPEAVSVVGFANEPFTELMEPSLSSVEQFSEEIGKNAAQLLFDQLKAPLHARIIREVTVVPRLMVRKSSNRKIFVHSILD